MNSKLCWLLLVVIVCFIAFTVEQRVIIGGRVAAPPTTVSLMMNKLMPKLAADIPKIPLPDVTGKIGTIIGDINYVISQIHLKSFSVESTTATFAAPDIINGRINKAIIEMNAAWSYKEASWPYIGDSGTCDGTVGVSGDFSMTISIDPVTKSMRFKMKSFVPQINSMNIQLHGGASWFYNIFMSLFQSVIINMMQDQLGGQVPPMIEAILQQEITNLYNPFAPVADSGLMTDYQFVSIAVTPDYIGFGVPTTDVKTFFPVFKPNVTQPKYPGVPKTDLPLFDAKFSDQMYQIALDEYYFNSLGWALVKNGKLSGLTITEDMVDETYKSDFYTNSYISTIPALANTFPDRKMKIEIGPGSDMVGFQIDKSSGLTAISDLIFSFSVLDPLVTNVFSLKVSIVGSVGLKFVDLKNFMYGDVKIIDWKSDGESSKIGQFNADVFKPLVSKIDSSILLPIANKFANQGLGIPSIGGMSLKDCKFETRDGYLILAGMMEYVPFESTKSTRKN